MVKIDERNFPRNDDEVVIAAKVFLLYSKQ